MRFLELVVSSGEEFRSSVIERNKKLCYDLELDFRLVYT